MNILKGIGKDSLLKSPLDNDLTLDMDHKNHEKGDNILK